MRYISAIILLFSSVMALAQNSQINGIVMDGELGKEPLAFAQVKVKGTNKVVTTNIEGKYKLNLDPGTYTIVFDFAGYESIELANVVIENKEIRQIDEALYALKIELNFPKKPPYWKIRWLSSD